nr:MAG TPA: hypothetical protein [Bacteriophage sp.]
MDYLAFHKTQPVFQTFNIHPFGGNKPALLLFVVCCLRLNNPSRRVRFPEDGVPDDGGRNG